MTPIPPVEERQYRSCDSCVFLAWVEDRCNMSGEIIDCLDHEDDPCPLHFAPDEMQVLIDQHNAGEQQPRQGGAVMAVIPDKLFSSTSRFDVGIFMLLWKAHEPTLPVKMVQEEGMWHCVPDRADEAGGRE